MRKTISFAKHYRKEYEHLINKNNPSEYVCDLIRKDRLKTNENIEEKILSVLQQIVKTGQLQIPKKQMSDKKKNALKNMLNI